MAKDEYGQLLKKPPHERQIDLLDKSIEFNSNQPGDIHFTTMISLIEVRNALAQSHDLPIRWVLPQPTK
jgi:hypothetical protein